MPITLPTYFPAGTRFEVACQVEATLYIRGPNAVTMESTDGVFAASPAVTSKWLPGFHEWAVRSPDGHELARGAMTVQPDIAHVAPGTDVRSHNRRVYDSICAVIERRASVDQQSYKINNRELVRMELRDLLRLKSQYLELVRREMGKSPFRMHLAVL